MQIAEENGLVNNFSKCFIKQLQISFISVTLWGDNMNPDPEKAQGILG